MVMELMHIRRDDEQGKGSINGDRQSDIGMRKVGKERRNDPIKNIPMRADAKHYDHKKNQQFSDQHIARMMACASAGINLGITVMNQMELPKPLILMQTNMNAILTKEI